MQTPRVHFRITIAIYDKRIPNIRILYDPTAIQIQITHVINNATSGIRRNQTIDHPELTLLTNLDNRMESIIIPNRSAIHHERSIPDINRTNLIGRIRAIRIIPQDSPLTHFQITTIMNPNNRRALWVIIRLPISVKRNIAQGQEATIDNKHTEALLFGRSFNRTARQQDAFPFRDRNGARQVKTAFRDNKLCRFSTTLFRIVNRRLQISLITDHATRFLLRINQDNGIIHHTLLPRTRHKQMVRIVRCQSIIRASLGYNITMPET